MRASLVGVLTVASYFIFVLVYAWFFDSKLPPASDIKWRSLLLITINWIFGAGLAVVVRRVDRHSGHEPSPRGEVSERRPGDKEPAP